MGGKSVEVLIDEVANALPVGTKFTSKEFSELTGIKKISCMARLLNLVADGYLTKEGSKGVVC